MTTSTSKVESLAQRVTRWKKDFPAFCAENLYIKTKDGRLIPFRLNRAQLLFWSKVQQQLDAGKPIRMYVLKARQLGFSTVIKALEYWLDTLHPYRNSLTVSHSLDSAAELFGKHQIFHSMSQPDVRPETKRSNRKEMRFAREPSDEEVRLADERGELPDIGLQSSLMVQTADNAHLGASFTLHFVHLSEFARYEKIRADVATSMATLMATVPHLRKTFVFIETTAFGLGYAKSFWDKSDNGFIKLFVSWVADETYRMNEWGDELPNGLSDLDDIADGPYGDELRVLVYIRSELRYWCSAESEDEEWFQNECLARLAWRRHSIRVAHQGSLDLFRQEYPIYAEEAFLTSGDHVFDTQKLSDMRTALYGEDGATSLHPVERYRFHRKPSPGFTRAKYGSLRVYERPQKGARYAIGADVSEGVSHGDASAAQVLRVPEMRQVAVFHAGYRDDEETQPPIDPDDFGHALDALGRWYNAATMAVEVNGPGFATNLVLGKALRYPLLYQREVFDAKYKAVQKKFGWHSNKATKNVAITDLRATLREDALLLLDERTIAELGYYVKHTNGSLGASSGEHDDLVTSLALAYQMAISMGTVRAARREPEKPEGSFDWWMGLIDKQRYVDARQ